MPDECYLVVDDRGPFILSAQQWIDYSLNQTAKHDCIPATVTKYDYDDTTDTWSPA